MMTSRIQLAIDVDDIEAVSHFFGVVVGARPAQGLTAGHVPQHRVGGVR